MLSFVVLFLVSAGADRPPVVPCFPSILPAASTQPAKTEADQSTPEWLVRADLPFPLAHHMAAAVEDSGTRTLFVMGGRRTGTGPMERTCLRYSPTSDRWSECEPMRNERGIGQAVTVRNQVYVLGGCEEFGFGIDRVERYDQVADEWVLLPRIPEGVHDFGAAVWRDSLIYLFGGGNWSPNSPPGRRVWRFNPSTGVWDTVTPLPTALGAMGCALIEDTIYIACGWTTAGPTNAVWEGVIKPEYPNRINWFRLDDMPAIPRCRPLSAALDGRFCLVGGILADGSVSDEVWSFEPSTRTWQELPVKPGPVADVYGAPALGSRLYAPGGFPGVNPYPVRHECLDIGGLDHDIGVDSLVSPTGRLEPGTAYTVSASIHNRGREPDTAYCSAWMLDSASQAIRLFPDVLLVLDPGQTQTVGFGDFVPEPGRYFYVVVAARSADDENADNDTIREPCRTASGSRPDGYGYTYRSTQEPDSVGFQWFDATQGSVITDWTPNPDDGVSRRTLPFPFPYYGSVIERVFVCTDGFLQTSDNTDRVNRRFPFVSLSDIIAPFWDDLSLRESGRVVETLLPDAAVYTWVNAPRCSAPAESLTFQVVLHSSGKVQFNYLKMDGDCTGSTVGIQGGDGSWNRYLEYAYDGEPASHIPTDYVTVLFSSSLADVCETELPGACTQISLLLPAVCAGPRLDVVLDWSGGQEPLLSVYDATGRLVNRLLLPAAGTGRSAARFSWDLCDRTGQRLAQGTYFIRAEAGGSSVTRRFILLR